MGKRKKVVTTKDIELITELVDKELKKLQFKQLKEIYEEEPETDLEKYVKIAALREMKRRNPNWSEQ